MLRRTLIRLARILRASSVAIAVAAVICGCQRGQYSATSLPRDLTAVPTIDVRALDLSRLATATSNSQRIYPGDTLRMTVVTGAEERSPEEWPLRVDHDGTVQVPLVGPIMLAGMDLQSAQDTVRKASIDRGIYRKPSVAISVADRKTNRITVMGAVETPGAYDIQSSACDLLSALSAAGGLSENASQVIEIKQPPLPMAGRHPTTPNLPPGSLAYLSVQQVGYDSPEFITSAMTVPMRVDLVAETMAPNPNGYGLRDGAVVMVRPRAPRVIHVMGLVKHPDQFEIPYDQDVRVLDALAMAGGRIYTIADHVLVIRQPTRSSTPALIEVSVRKAKSNGTDNILLAPGDVVSVEETPTTMTLSALRQFVHFGVNSTASVF